MLDWLRAHKPFGASDTCATLAFKSSTELGFAISDSNVESILEDDDIPVPGRRRRGKGKSATDALFARCLVELYAAQGKKPPDELWPIVGHPFKK